MDMIGIPKLLPMGVKEFYSNLKELESGTKPSGIRFLTSSIRKDLAVPADVDLGPPPIRPSSVVCKRCDISGTEFIGANFRLSSSLEIDYL